MSLFTPDMAKNKNLYYFFKKTNHNFNNAVKLLYLILSASFKAMRCIISKPIVIRTPKKIIIKLFYYAKPLTKSYYFKLQVRNKLRRIKNIRNRNMFNRNLVKIRYYNRSLL